MGALGHGEKLLSQIPRSSQLALDVIKPAQSPERRKKLSVISDSFAQVSGGGIYLFYFFGAHSFCSNQDWTKLQSDSNPCPYRIRALRQTLQNFQRLVKGRNCFFVRTTLGSLRSGLMEIRHRFFPHLAPEGMMREPFYIFCEPFRVKL